MTLATAEHDATARRDGALVFERLRLQGFGRHRDLDVRFPEGLGIWSAPNEQGKTTAVLGLAATLWGVPHRSDPAAPGWGRYRSWHGGPHRGALTLRAPDGARYTVERAFESHRVRVVRHDEDGDTLLVDAVHNPAARVAMGPFDTWLAATVGVVDGELALATAVLAQGDLGGDPHRLGSDVQRLLSGAGAGGAPAALERLADALRERTRVLRPLDLGLADLRQPRRLEQLEAEADALRRRAEAGRRSADGLERDRRALAEAEEALERARLEAERTRAAADARRAWTAARDEVRRVAERVRTKRIAVERSAALAAEVRRAEHDLHALCGDAAPPPRAEDDLQALRSADSALATAERRRSEAASALDAHRSEDPDTAVDTALRGAAATADHVQGDPVAATPSSDAWAALGADAPALVARARRGARTLTRRVEAARALRARLRADEATLARVRVFDDLPNDVLDLVSGFGQRERALVDRVQAARSRRDDLLERVRRHRAAFADVRHLNQGEIRALEAFDEALERRRDPRPWRFATAIGGAVVGALALPWVVETLRLALPATSAIGAVIGAALGAFAPIGDGTARARRGVAEAGLTGDDDDLRQRLRQRAAFDAQYDQVQADARALEEAEAALVVHEAEGRAFLDAVEPVIDALPTDLDVDEAYRTWTRVRPLVAAGRSELAALVADLIEGDEWRDGGDASDPAAARDGDDPLRFDESQVHDDGPLADLLRIADVLAAAPLPSERRTVGALAAWVASLDDADWLRWEAEARAAAAAVDAGEGRGPGADAARERRRAWGEALAGSLAAADADHRAARARYAEAVTAVRAWWPLLRRSDGVGPAATSAAGTGPTGTSPATARVVGDAGAALIGEDDLLAGDGWSSPSERPAATASDAAIGDPALDTARVAADLAAVREAQGRLRESEREHGAHLRSQGEAHHEALTAGVAPLERALAVAQASWAALCERHPDLPEARLDEGAPDAFGTAAGDPVGDAAGDALASAFERVETAAAQAAEGERAAQRALLEAQRRVAASEGAESVNVAALLEASRERQAEAASVRAEVEALALAYAELDASIRAFTASHRERLEERTSALFAALSSVPARRVRLDDAFAASVLEPSGDVALPVQLSQGARDQLALSLRLAVLDLVAAEVPLPLVLDDPFVHWDEARLREARAMLATLASQRQVVLLTHRHAFDAWGAPVSGAEAA